MPGYGFRLISSFIRHGAGGDREFLKKKTSPSGILTFLVSLLQRNPFAQALLAVASHFRRSRCRSRMFIVFALAVGLLLLWTMLGSPLSYCVNYTPFYVRRTLDEQYEVLFPNTEQVTNSCPFCHNLRLSSLSCHQAKLYCTHDPAYENNRKRYLCDCNCGTFASSTSAEPPSSQDESTTAQQQQQEQQQQNKNILFFTTRELVLSPASQHDLLYFEAAKDLPDLSAYMFGPGFEGYNEELSVSENLAAMFPGVRFDVVFIQVPSRYAFSDAVYAGLTEMAQPVADGNNGPTVILRLHECRYGSCDRHLTRTGAHVVLFAYARDLLQYSRRHGDKLMVHLPHAVHAPVFSNHSVTSPLRKTDVVLAGGYGREYPFGRRLYTMIQDGVISGARVLDPPPTDNLEVRPDLQYRVYLSALEAAKIVMVTSSVERLLLIRHGEAAMSGALLAGDFPLGHRAELRKGMVELSDDMSDSEIVKALRYYLDHTQEREKRVLEARRAFMLQYSTWKFFAALRDAVRLYGGGGRGLIYPQYFVSEDMLQQPSCAEFYSQHVRVDFRYLAHRISALFS